MSMHLIDSTYTIIRTPINDSAYTVQGSRVRWSQILLSESSSDLRNKLVLFRVVWVGGLGGQGSAETPTFYRQPVVLLSDDINTHEFAEGLCINFLFAFVLGNKLQGFS